MSHDLTEAKVRQRLLYEAGSSEAEVHDYLQRWGLMSPNLAAHLIRFMNDPMSRTYLMTYPAGHKLCSSYVAGDPQRFLRLLTEQVRVRELVESQQGALRRS